MVLIVVPAFSKSEQSQDLAVATLVMSFIPLGSNFMGERVDHVDGVVKQDSQTPKPTSEVHSCVSEARLGLRKPPRNTNHGQEDRNNSIKSALLHNWPVMLSIVTMAHGTQHIHFRCRVHNWRTYNQPLVARGEITFWIDETASAAWRNTQAHSASGAPRIYSDTAIHCAMVVKSVNGLRLRAVRGMDIVVPDPGSTFEL